MEHHTNVHHGMSLSDAIRAARTLGVVVERPRRTGEVRFSYGGLTPVTANGRRKDSPRTVTAFLIRVRRLHG